MILKTQNWSCECFTIRQTFGKPIENQDESFRSPNEPEVSIVSFKSGLTWKSIGNYIDKWLVIICFWDIFFNFQSNNALAIL